MTQARFWSGYKAGLSHYLTLGHNFSVCKKMHILFRSCLDAHKHVSRRFIIDTTMCGRRKNIFDIESQTNPSSPQPVDLSSSSINITDCACLPACLPTLSPPLTGDWPPAHLPMIHTYRDVILLYFGVAPLLSPATTAAILPSTVHES